jgi:enoyl-CoA hydratase
MNTPIEVDTVGHVLRLTINAPHKRNALTPEMLCRLADAVVAFSTDPELRRDHRRR